MKKPKGNSKPARAKAPAAKRKAQGDPILNFLKNLDPDTVAALKHAIREEMDIDSETSDGPVEMFAAYLEMCARSDADEDDAKSELLSDLVAVLGDVRVDANGGDRDAREQIQAVYDLLGNAIERGALPAVDLMMTAKIFADAGWAIPDGLKQAMAEAMEAGAPTSEGVAGMDLVSSLLQLTDMAEQNPFDLHEHLNSLMAAIPTQAIVALLGELIASKNALVDQTVAGFVLHPDAVVAQSVVDALAASAAHTPVASALIERLVRMRSWLPLSRQAHLDACIRAMRLNALAPVKQEPPKILKCHVSVCDGSGTRSLFVVQRADAHYQIATVMMKVGGVADAMVLRDLAKSDADEISSQMKSSAPAIETDLSGVARMLGLAIADNLAAGAPPPYKLVEVVEALGLGPIHPDRASPIEIITGLLADLPPEQTNPAAVARAHADLLGSEFAYQWFEAGAALDDILSRVKGAKPRAARLMKDYLPERRQFWARQCALSALAMHGDPKARHSQWKPMALVGRDIASDMPLDQIPLMKQVAAASVRAFELRS